jgi:SAM-dependent methyltransferase
MWKKLHMSFNRLHPSIRIHSYLTLIALRKALLHASQTALIPGKKYRILDLGCGEKPYYPLFKNWAAEYIGIDIYAGDLRGIGEFLPFRNNSFDLIISTQTLEHVNDPLKVISEISRVLTPGGIIILSTHGIWYNHGDHWRWTESGLLKIFSSYFQVKILENGGAILCFFQFLCFYAMLVPIFREIIIPVFNTAGEILDTLIPIPKFLTVNYTVIGKKI